MPAALKDLNSGNAFALQDFNLIGRSEGATIQLADSGISRQHATIRREGANYWLVDLGSANGSFVNDIALTAPRVLRDGDRLQFGRSVLLFDQDEPSAKPPRPVADGKTQISQTTSVPFRSQAVTLLVADLQGFTQMSSQLSADQVADLLREWYADCNAILKHYGALDRQVHRRLRLRLLARHGGRQPARARRMPPRRCAPSEMESTSPTRLLLSR